MLQYSDSIHFNNNGQINWVIDTIEAQNWTTEMMANLDTYSDQILVSKLSEFSYDTTGGPTFYRHAGFEISIRDNKLTARLYGIDTNIIQRKVFAESVRDVSEIVALNKWTHIIVERVNNLSVPIQIWVNGNPTALQFVINDLNSAEIYSGDGNLIVGAHDADQLPMPGKIRGSIKNLRIYNRVLAASEIRQNSFNNCQLPVNKGGLVFWSPMNAADSNKVKDFISQNYGLLTGFTWEPFSGVFPRHRLPTVYEYNSFAQVVNQFTPDGDTSAFWYDRLGRLIASQNKEQKENASYSGSAYRFSYTKYDVLGRIIEVGEKSNPTDDIA